MPDEFADVRKATVDILRELKNANFELRDRVRIAAFVVAAVALLREACEDDTEADEILTMMCDMGFTLPVERKWVVRH